jgi:hemerythrin-like domain-containing protein
MRWMDDLVSEHRVVGRMLKVMRAMASQIESGGEVAEGDIAGTLEFLRVFVDECHHGKEEKHLIPVLARTGVPVDSGIVALVFEEHAQGRQYVSEMRKHAAGISIGDVGMSMGDPGAATAGFVAAARDYSSLLERHITREEGELFPLAALRLDEDAQTELADAFDTLEEDVIGPGVHETLQEMLDHLEDAYPGR